MGSNDRKSYKTLSTHTHAHVHVHTYTHRNRHTNTELVKTKTNQKQKKIYIYIPGRVFFHRTPTDARLERVVQENFEKEWRGTGRGGGGIRHPRR